MAKKDDTWMPLYIGEYMADTMFLSTEKHGAYLLLLMACWKGDGYLPTDDDRLSSITRLPIDRWLSYKTELTAFFRLSGNRYTHKRVLEEREKAKKLVDSKSEAGKLGAEARWHKDGTANGKTMAQPMANACDGNGKAMHLNSNSNNDLLQPPSDSPKPRKVKNTSPTKSATPKTAFVWDSYERAYASRWGPKPVRNQKVNGMLARFLERVPADEAPDIAAFYLQSNRGLYVSAKHPVDLLLRDAEALRTEWVTGKQGTETAARQADKTQANGDVWQRLIDKNEAANGKQ